MWQAMEEIEGCGMMRAGMRSAFAGRSIFRDGNNFWCDHFLNKLNRQDWQDQSKGNLHRRGAESAEALFLASAPPRSLRLCGKINSFLPWRSRRPCSTFFRKQMRPHQPQLRQTKPHRCREAAEAVFHAAAEVNARRLGEIFRGA